MKIEKKIISNRIMDGIEVSFDGCSLTWAGYHSHLLIVLIEQDWKYDNLIDYLTNEWEKESYHAVTRLSKFLPPHILKDMQRKIRMYIIEKVFDFKRTMTQGKTK